MEGRYWYDEEENLEEEKPVITKENAAEELIKVREKLDTAKALAILSPTKQNIRHYMILQKEVVENAENFSQVWAKIVLEDAVLNTQIKNPTAQYAINARKALEYETIEKTLLKNKNHHLLLFVYDSEQKFSQIAADMMKTFEKDTNWEVIGVSVDSKNLPEFPNSKISIDKGKTLGISTTPSYVLINKETEEIIHAGFGALSVSQLKENIFMQLKERF